MWEERTSEGPRPKPLTVTEACEFARKLLARHTLRIVGEVSELTDKRGYKAVYLTVKDEGATLSCMMWKNRYQALGLPLEIGTKIIMEGRLSVYAPRGDMQFEISTYSLEGEGELRAKVARLARQLQAEGLMAPERKRSLVPFPEVIGLVTSPNGAVVHDVLRTLRRRFPACRVLFAGVQVEGATAAADMIRAMECVASYGAQEVLLVRGGGSFESMMPFNDEALCRYVAASPVPVITGIGHEPDTFLADLVADLRCSTPTAAAEAIFPHQDELSANLGSLESRLNTYITNRLDRCVQYLDARASRPVLADPLSLFATEMQMLDRAQDTLERGLDTFVGQRGAELDSLQVRLGHALESSCSLRVAAVDAAADRLRASGSSLVAPFQQQAALATARLNDLSPLRTLERGWSIAKDCKGSVITSVQQTEPGDAISVQLIDGTLSAHVTETTPACLPGTE